ncbi:hypothetical protein SDC9_210497 [bioreactor metagenome]|uniref:Uncharacterized protein n=1 Tax=bioreactor metagenome TaxID=1076179 RepID=A0A645JRF0_9ZZZZ
MPMAASVPITVAKMVEITAMINVLASDDKITSLVNIFLYQSNVKPVQSARDLEELNEKTINTAIGAYRKAMITPR